MLQSLQSFLEHFQSFLDLLHRRSLSFFPFSNKDQTSKQFTWNNEAKARSLRLSPSLQTYGKCIDSWMFNNWLELLKLEVQNTRIFQQIYGYKLSLINRHYSSFRSSVFYLNWEKIKIEKPLNLIWSEGYSDYRRNRTKVALC